MNIAIMTDSTCDLDPGAEAQYHIDIVPLLVTFGEKSYQDGVDMSKRVFFSRLAKASMLPFTSQPSPATFQALFRRRLDEGSEVIGIFLSSTLSGTYQSAVTARSLFHEEEQRRIHLVDSRNGTGSMAILVLEACRLRDQGTGIPDILAHIHDLIPRVRLFAIYDTPKYLKMGGRISGAVAAVSGVLNIVPVLTLVSGSITAADKIRKNPNAFRKWLREKLTKDLPDPQYPVFFLHGNNPDLTLPLREEFKYLTIQENTYTLCIGAVIGTHLGPNAYGMTYVTKEK